MQSLRLMIVLVCLVCVVSLWSHRAMAIVGGELDGEVHPNVGAWVLVNLQNPIPGYDVPLPDANGAGTLIHPRVVLVAGHGTALVEEDLAAGYYTLEDLKFSFGSDALDPATWRDISAVITHPDYDPNLSTGGGATPLADVGVLILEQPVNDIQPATLPPEGLLDFLEAAGALGGPPDGAKFTVVGYGIHGDAPNQLLPRDGQRRVAQSEFLLLHDHWLFLDQNPAHSNGGTAAGDSGGPSFRVDPETGEEILVSLTSRGDAAFVGIGITYRVDTHEALDFLNSVIDVVESGGL